MIVVLDTNVFVAAMVAKGLCHEVVVRSLGSCTVATSQSLLDELEYTLRAKFTLGPAGMSFLEQLRLRVRIVEPTPLRSPVSRDADDDVVPGNGRRRRSNRHCDRRPGPSRHRPLQRHRHRVSTRLLEPSPVLTVAGSLGGDGITGILADAPQGLANG